MVSNSYRPGQAADFWNPGPNRDVSDKTVEMIQRRTEGWIAGLQMARLSMVHADNPETFAMNFSGSDRLIVDFLDIKSVEASPIITGGANIGDDQQNDSV